MINRCIHTYRIHLRFIASVSFHYDWTFDWILHHISRNITERVSGYLLILITNYLSWVYSTIMYMWHGKSTAFKISSNIFRNDFLSFQYFYTNDFRNLWQLTQVLLVWWYYFCFKFELLSEQRSEIVVYRHDLSKILPRNNCMDQHQERKGTNWIEKKKGNCRKYCK